jgi:hypothetical protein
VPRPAPLGRFFLLASEQSPTKIPAQAELGRGTLEAIGITDAIGWVAWEGYSVPIGLLFTNEKPVAHFASVPGRVFGQEEAGRRTYASSTRGRRACPGPQPNAAANR